jgi:ribosomal protein S18 acetylase RimI-like enzyme
MPVPEHFHRFWCRLDEQLGRVQPTWWGAVITDPRFPAISDANYARIDAEAPDLTAADVEAALLPALAQSGVEVMHVVSFHPLGTEGLLDELVGRGHRRTWDLVMDLVREPPGPTDVRVEEPVLDEDFWARIEESFGLFGVEPHEVSVQLMELERALERTGAKRWFAVRDGGGPPLAVAALIVLDGVGYLDNVCTFPQARGRGYASAVTVRAIHEARDAGAGHVTLLADPEADAVIRMYERLGFEPAGRIAATRGALPDQSGSGR